MVVFAGESIGFGEDEGPDSAVNGRAISAIWAGPPSWSITRSSGVSASIPSRSFRPPFSGPAASPWRVREVRCFVSMPMEYLFDTMTKDVPSDLGSCALGHRRSEGHRRAGQYACRRKESGDRHRRLRDDGEERRMLWSRSPNCSVVPWWKHAAPERSTFRAPIRCTAAYDPKEVVQGADVIFLLAVIAPWHPASITPSPGAKVAMLDENPLRSRDSLLRLPNRSLPDRRNRVVTGAFARGA